MMTSRERVLAALNRQPTDRVPFSLGFGVNPPVKARLLSKLGMDTIAQVDEYLQSHSDLRWVSPKYIGPKERMFTGEYSIGTDIWGVKRAPVAYNSEDSYMEICENPLADINEVSDLDDILWPSIDWFDFSDLTTQIDNHNKNNETYAIVMGNGNIFETSWYMRGFEQMLMDLLINPELAEAIMTRVTNFFIEYFTAALNVTNRDGGAPIDIIFTADDIGGQEGLLFSLDLWERMIKPHHVRMNRVLHSFGTKVMYHTDGAVMEALGGLVDMGIDILEAIQFDAKEMSPEIMKRDYGDKLCFHGGISVQSTLPFGTPSDVETEINERIRVLGENGGYILAPSHAIQAGTPVENVLKFLSYARGQAKGAGNAIL